MSYAPFDDGASIYAYALDELRTLAEYFSTLQLTTVTQATFTQQDILLHGDLKSLAAICQCPSPAAMDAAGRL